MTNVTTAPSVDQKLIDKQFQVNKWIRMGLSILLVMLGAAITYMAGLDWKSLVGPDKAGLMVAFISIIKTLYESFAPAAGVQVAPTTGTLITHVSVPTNPAAPVA